MNKARASLILVGFLSLFLFLSTSCHRSKLVLAWGIPHSDLTKYKNVLVIGIMGDKDVSLRQDMELDLIEAFNRHGMSCCSAFEKFGETSFADTTIDPLTQLRKMQDDNYDAIVSIVLLDRRQRKKYIPGKYKSDNGMVYREVPSNNHMTFNGNQVNSYSGFSNYYADNVNMVYMPGYYKATENYIIEVTVFDMKTNDVLYSAESKIYAPHTLERMSTEVKDEVVKDLLKKKFIHSIKK